MNLIICTTPLQVIIAEKISEIHDNETFFGVMLNFGHNAKYDYYYKKMNNFCVESTMIAEPSYSFISRVKMIVKIHNFIKSINHVKLDSLFLANISDLNISYLASHLMYEKIITFDDGIGNIFYEGIFYNENTRPLYRFLRKLLRIKFDIHTFKSASEQHYTIYKGQPNIIENTKSIQLFDFKKNETVLKTGTEKTEVILLGQPPLPANFTDMSDTDYLQLVDEVVSLFDVSYYFPHPRETYHVDSCEVINTELIVEDYLLNYMKPNYKYKIYHFYSSAVLSMLGVENIEIISLFPKEYTGAYILPIYKRFEELNVKIIEI